MPWTVRSCAFQGMHTVSLPRQGVIGSLSLSARLRWLVGSRSSTHFGRDLTPLFFFLHIPWERPRTISHRLTT